MTNGNLPIMMLLGSLLKPPKKNIYPFKYPFFCLFKNFGMIPFISFHNVIFGDLKSYLSSLPQLHINV